RLEVQAQHPTDVGDRELRTLIEWIDPEGRARRPRRPHDAQAGRGVDAAGQAEGEQRAAGGAAVMAVGVQRAGRALAWGSLLTFSAACHGPQNVLDPVGAPNRATSRLFWAMLIVSA